MVISRYSATLSLLSPVAAAKNSVLASATAIAASTAKFATTGHVSAVRPDLSAPSAVAARCTSPYIREPISRLRCAAARVTVTSARRRCHARGGVAATTGLGLAVAAAAATGSRSASAAVGAAGGSPMSGLPGSWPCRGARRGAGGGRGGQERTRRPASGWSRRRPATHRFSPMPTAVACRQPVWPDEGCAANQRHYGNNGQRDDPPKNRLRRPRRSGASWRRC